MFGINKTIIIGTISAIVIALSAFTQPSSQPNKETPSNLKILPKNISNEELTQVMRGFNAALGVKCNYCHAPKSNGDKGLDFVSDSNTNKDIARSMMKMTKKINKKYFTHPHEGLIQSISCETCHNGQAHPKTLTMK